MYYHAGTVFAGPAGNDECLHWKPTAADAAADPSKSSR